MCSDIKPFVELVKIDLEVNVELVSTINFYSAYQVVDDHFLGLETVSVVHPRPCNNFIVLFVQFSKNILKLGTFNFRFSNPRWTHIF
ncbi:hypothetical protein SAMN05192585_1153 [Acetanaerobacterium elongatum]|uniref:Uncharacterized protein n=1 Tax=Acetanaerobacterium elongatum TaxID=258515 RepID=A0A1H0A0S3_9FIRM|nr:hypothetical protein SAMN05192585_1153 [Acetanaerobacterium elongatum]